MLEQVVMWLAGILATISMMAVVGLYKMIKDTRDSLANHRLHVAEEYAGKTEVKDYVKTFADSLSREIVNVDDKVKGCDAKLDRLLELELNKARDK